MNFRAILLVVVGLAASTPAFAQNCTSLPNTLTNGTTADATQVMANFTYLGLTCGASQASPVFSGTASFSGDVGIGTTSPGYPLQVNGSSYFQNSMGIGNTGAAALIIKPSALNTPQTWAVDVQNSGGGGVFTVDNSGDGYFAGNVGIGTTSPAAALQINGNNGIGETLYVDNTAASSLVAPIVAIAPSLSTGGEAYINLGVAASTNNWGGMGFHYAGSGSTSNRLDFSFYSGATPLSLLANGNVGIGTTSPAVALTVNGQIATTGTGNIVSATNMGWESTASGGTELCYTTYLGVYIPEPCSSLRQFKNNIRDLGIGVDTLLKLRPVEFDWNKDHGGRHDLGFIAQEVEKVDPLLAEYNNKDGSYKLIGVKYMQLTALLTKSVQELVARLGDDESQIAHLAAAKSNADAKIMRLERDLANSTTRNAALEREAPRQTVTPSKLIPVHDLAEENAALRAHLEEDDRRLDLLEARLRVRNASLERLPSSPDHRPN